MSSFGGILGGCGGRDAGGGVQADGGGAGRGGVVLVALAVADGHDVVNGTPLWNPPDHRDPSEYAGAVQPPRDKYLALLLGLPSRTGGRLLWLTSTSKGLDLYPELPETDPEPLLAIDYQATTVVHGERNKFYSTSTRTTPVRLYATSGIPPAGPAKDSAE